MMIDENENFESDYEENEDGSLEDEEEVDEEVNSEISDDMKKEKNVNLKRGSQYWPRHVIGGNKTAVCWGKPQFEEVNFPWNKPNSKKPVTKGQGFKKFDHI